MKNKISLVDDGIVPKPTLVESGIRLKSSDIDGIPRIFTIPLVPFRIDESRADHLISSRTALYLGILVKEDSIITFAPVNVPDMEFTVAKMVVEFTDYTDEPQPTICSLTCLYTDKSGYAHAPYSSLLVAEGGKFEFPIPNIHLRTKYCLPTALGVTLMSSTPKGKQPVLVRGVWLEF